MKHLGCSLSCLADVPDAPENLKATDITHNSIKCRWTAPKATGISKITIYRLTATPSNGTSSARKGSVEPTKDLQYTFSNLQKDTSYLIKVSAYNKAGQGKVEKAIFKTSRKAGKMFERSYTISAGNDWSGHLSLSLSPGGTYSRLVTEAAHLTPEITA